MVDGLAETGTYLNKEQLCVGQPQFQDALTGGLMWTILHKDCAVAFRKCNEHDGIAGFIQGALNCSVKTSQSEVELMLRMAKRAGTILSSASMPSAEWEAIERSAVEGLPACAPWIKSIRGYVQVTTLELLNELVDFARTISKTETLASGRMLGGDFLNKLSMINFGPGQKRPYILSACIKVQWLNPAVKNNICNFLTPGNLNELSKPSNKALVMKAESLLHESRSTIDRLTMSASAKTKLRGKVDCRVVCFLLKKGKELENKNYKTLDEVSKAESALHVIVLIVYVAKW